jgi:magnesium transporter
MSPSAGRAANALISGYMRLYPEEASRRLDGLPVREIIRLLDGQPAPQAAGVAERMAPDVASQVVKEMADASAARLLGALDPLRAAELLARLEENDQNRLLGLMETGTARIVRSVMSYPEDSAGKLMDRRVMTFRPESTAREVLTRIRVLKRRRIHDIVVTDEEGRLLGTVPLQDVAVSPPSEPLSALVHGSPVSVPVMADKEEVVEMMGSLKLTSLPVVDFENRILGIIRQNTLVAAVQEEVSADIQTMVGASKEERALSRAAFAIRKRLPWLEINLLTAFLASAVVGLFEDTIARFTALAVLLPVVAGQSGNTGAQALAVTMRGLALREVRAHQWMRLLIKEFKVGLANGVAIAATTSLAVFVWSGSPGLAAVIGMAMVCSMIAAGLAGVTIPILLTALDQDPAQSSSIVLTTITDVVGFFSFLGIATLLSGIL